MTPDDIAHAMTGTMHAVSENRQEAFLPSPMIQNHASFLHLLNDGTLLCAWFGGTLEGKSDISIFASVLISGATSWGAPQRLSRDPDHSEQNPVLFTAPDGILWLFHTVQPSGNQDECRIRMAPSSRIRSGARMKQPFGRSRKRPSSEMSFSGAVASRMTRAMRMRHSS